MNTQARHAKSTPKGIQVLLLLAGGRRLIGAQGLGAWVLAIYTRRGTLPVRANTKRIAL